MAVQRGPLARIEVAGAWPLGEAELAREALQRQRRRHSPHSLSESRLDELGIPAPLCSRDERLRAPDKPQNGRVDGGWRCEHFRRQPPDERQLERRAPDHAERRAGPDGRPFVGQLPLDDHIRRDELRLLDQAPENLRPALEREVRDDAKRLARQWHAARVSFDDTREPLAERGGERGIELDRDDLGARARAVVARARTRKTVIVVIRREAYPPIMATTAGENRQRRTIRPDERLIAVSSLPARASEEGTASSVDRSPAPESRNRRRRERAGARHPSRRSSLHRTPRPTRGRRRCTRGWSPSAAHREGVASAPSGRGHPPRSCKASQGRRRTLRGTRGRVDGRPPTPRPTIPTSRVAREGGWSKTSPRRHGRRSSGWLRTRAACRPGPRSAPGDSRRDTFVLTRVRGLGS